MKTIGQGTLSLHQLLSQQAQKANDLQGLSNALLLLIDQLRDDDCIAVFDTRSLQIYKQGILMVKGQRNWTDGLWDVRIDQPQESINVIIRKDTTKQHLNEYLYKCAFSPFLSTFQRAIQKGHFLTWPGIDKINFEKYIYNLAPTAKGHLDQERANLQSTQEKEELEMLADFEPNNNSKEKTWEDALLIYSFKPKEKHIPIKQAAFHIVPLVGMNTL